MRLYRVPKVDELDISTLTINQDLARDVLSSMITQFSRESQIVRRRIVKMLVSNEEAYLEDIMKLIETCLAERVFKKRESIYLENVREVALELRAVLTKALVD